LFLYKFLYNILFYFFFFFDGNKKKTDPLTNICKPCSIKCGSCGTDTSICLTCKSGSGRTGAPDCNCADPAGDRFPISGQCETCEDKVAVTTVISDDLTKITIELGFSLSFDSALVPFPSLASE
jgi:hypothetical protein